MGIRKAIASMLVLSLLLIFSACDYNTADINLYNVKLTQVHASCSSAWYLAEDGTLYSPGADPDASSYVVYQNQEEGIVAEGVILFEEMMGGGCYINKDNDLYMWNRDTIPSYGYNKAKVHQCIVKNVKSVCAANYNLLYIDLNDNLYLLGEYEGSTYTINNPKLLANDVACVANQSGASIFLWAYKDGGIGSVRVDDIDLLAEMDSLFGDSAASDIFFDDEFIAILYEGQLWFYGDYAAFCSGTDIVTKQWVQIDDNIAEISCRPYTIGALTTQGQMKIWGKCLSNDATNTESPEFKYYEEKVIAENAKSIFLDGGCVGYIDQYGKSHMFHTGGYRPFYGNATTDEYVGINREPNTWIKSKRDKGTVC